MILGIASTKGFCQTDCFDGDTPALGISDWRSFPAVPSRAPLVNLRFSSSYPACCLALQGQC